MDNKPGAEFKGTHYYNNGIKEVRTFECPEGYVKGRLPGQTRERK